MTDSIKQIYLKISFRKIKMFHKENNKKNYYRRYMHRVQVSYCQYNEVT